eukprot:Pgem_evm1s1206
MYMSKNVLLTLGVICLGINSAKASSLLPLSERPLEFAAIGDWGFDPAITSYNGKNGFKSRGTQEAVAASMGDPSQYSNQDGPDFILNNGDSFYSHGVTSNTDAFWKTSWYDVYSKHGLTAKPWFSIMGNHDYQRTSCGCADPFDPTPKECAQINPDLSYLGSDVNWVYKAKSYSDDRYLHSHKVMVVNVDTNYIDPSTCEFSDHGSCTKDICKSKAGDMQKAAEAFFGDFLASDAVKNAKTIVINSHYPWPYENWLGPGSERADWALRLKPFKNMIVDFANANKQKNLLFFAGHTHKIEETGSPVSNLKTWITGGGGGYHHEGDQGWYKVQIETNGDYKVTPK